MVKKGKEQDDRMKRLDDAMWRAIQKSQLPVRRWVKDEVGAENG